MRQVKGLRLGYTSLVSNYEYFAASPDGDFVNHGHGPIRGGMLFAAVPGRLRDEFGPSCVVLEYEGRDDSVFFGEMADQVRESILSNATPAFGAASFHMAG